MQTAQKGTNSEKISGMQMAKIYRYSNLPPPAREAAALSTRPPDTSEPECLFRGEERAVHLAYESVDIVIDEITYLAQHSQL